MTQQNASPPGSDVVTLRQPVLMFWGLVGSRTGREGDAFCFCSTKPSKRSRVVVSVARFGSLRALARWLEPHGRAGGRTHRHIWSRKGGLVTLWPPPCLPHTLTTMTILPKKKPSSGVGVSDHADDSDRRSGSDPHQHPHAGRTGARPRASPPPWSYQPAPPSARDDRRSIEASSRPQQASPPPVGSVSPVGPGDGRDSSGGMVAGSRGELVVSAGVVGCGGSIGSCCSGPGLSKRRRQAGTCSGGVVAALAGGGQPGVTGPGGVGSSQDTEEGAGNNSEDEYENAARLQSMDPATVEQVGS